MQLFLLNDCGFWYTWLVKFYGEVPEWPNGAVSKTVELSRVPRVRIPVSPPNSDSYLFVVVHYCLEAC